MIRQRSEPAGCYRAYGLLIRSDFDLPHLVLGSGGPDVHIRSGPVSFSPASVSETGAAFEVHDDIVYLFYRGFGRYAVRNGSEIVAERLPGSDEQVFRLLLTGPVLAVLLHLRGSLVLHASTVSINGEAASFLGPHGSGKSTIAAVLHARGHGLLADDITAIETVGSERIVHAAAPLFKLWPEAVTSLGDDVEGFPRIFQGREKRIRPARERFTTGSPPLKRLYVLEDGEETEIAPLQGHDSAVEIVRHSFLALRIGQLRESGPPHLVQCARLAEAVPVRRLIRRRDLSQLHAVASRVEEDLVSPAEQREHARL